MTPDPFDALRAWLDDEIESFRRSLGQRFRWLRLND